MAGHRCKHPPLEFGEVVFFRVAPDKTGRHKADEYWHEGVFLGVETDTTEFLVTTGAQVYTCAHQHVRRVTAETAYGVDYLEKIKVDFYDYLIKGASTADPGLERLEGNGDLEVGNGLDKETGPTGYVPRSFKIGEAQGLKYGFTESCPGRIWRQLRIGPRQNHSEECRARFRRLIEEYEQDKDTVQRTEARKKEWEQRESKVHAGAGGDPRQGLEDKAHDKGEVRERVPEGVGEDLKLHDADAGSSEVRNADCDVVSNESGKGKGRKPSPMKKKEDAKRKLDDQGGGR